MPAGLLVTVPLPEPVLVTESVCMATPDGDVLTENERALEVVGLAAVCDWFVTTRTRAAQPAGLKPLRVLDCPLATTDGSALSESPAPVSQATVPRNWPPADVFASTTLYALALVGSATQATA